MPALVVEGFVPRIYGFGDTGIKQTEGAANRGYLHG